MKFKDKNKVKTMLKATAKKPPKLKNCGTLSNGIIGIPEDKENKAGGILKEMAEAFPLQRVLAQTNLRAS